MKDNVKILKRVKSGIIGLDEIFGGGFIKGSITLVAGHPGTGKTLFGLQFLKEGLESGEKCIYVSLIEDPLQILEYYDILDFDWSRYIKQGSLVFCTSKILTLEKLSLELGKVFNERDKFRLFVDDFTIRQAGGTKQRLLSITSSIVNQIRKFRVPAVITSELIEEEKYFGLGKSILTQFSDNISVMKQIELEGKITGLFGIFKSRGTFSDKRIREMVIGKYGLEVKDIVEGYKNIFSSTPVASKIDLNINFSKKYVEKYQKKHPDIIMQETGIHMTPEEKIREITSAGTTIGATTLPYSLVYDLAKDGYLLNLDECIIDRLIYNEKAVSACTYENKIYAIPEDISCKCLVYRKDLLEKYNKSVPSTWAELVETAKYIISKENNQDLNGLLFFCGDTKELTDVFLEFALSNGEDIIDTEGNINLNNDKTVEALKFMKELVNNSAVMGPNPISLWDADIIKKYTEGKAVFLKFTPGILRSMEQAKSEIKDQTRIAPLPGMVSDRESYGALDGTALVIPKNTKYPKAAIQFLKYYIDIERAKDIELSPGAGYPFPARVKFLNDPEILEQKPYYSKGPAILKNCFFPSKTIKNYHLISLLVHKKISQVLKQEITPEKALETLAEDINKVKRHKVYRKIVENAIAFMDKNYSKKISRETIALSVRLSPSYMARVFKFQTEMTVVDYLIKIRIEKAKELLKDPKYNVSEIAAKVGYTDVSYFCKLFKKTTGYNPSEFRLL